MLLQQSFELPLPPHQSIIWLAHCHHISQSFDLPSTTMSLCYHITALLHYHISQSFDLPSTTMSLCYHITALLHYHISQSFDLPSTTTSLCYRITTLLHYHVTVSPHHWVTVWDLPTTLIWIIWLAPTTALLHHCITALPHEIFPYHIGMNHLTFPYHNVTDHCVTVSPCYHVTALPHYCITTWDFPHHIIMNHLTCPYHHITTSPHHHVTMLLCYHVTTLCMLCIHKIFPTTLVWIWLVNATQHSSDWLIVPTMANQVISIWQPNWHKILIFPPPPLWKGHMEPE